MAPNDEETERYLMEFRPRAIHELNIAPIAREILPRWLAAAAALALIVAGLLWFVHRKAARLQVTADGEPPKVQITRPQRYQSNLALTRLALVDNGKLESLLAEESRRVLPTVQGKLSTLKILAKE